MALYMLQASFTSQAIGALAQNPQDRAAVFNTVLGKLGGRVHNFYYSFGDSDVVVIYEVPDDNTAVAATFAVGAAGHLINIKTTKLITNEDAMAAMKQAGTLRVPAPTQS
jgi:uncharacterized protein with GYD domain